MTHRRFYVISVGHLIVRPLTDYTLLLQKYDFTMHYKICLKILKFHIDKIYVFVKQ